MERSTVRVKCLAHEHITMFPARARTGRAPQSEDEQSLGGYDANTSPTADHVKHSEMRNVNEVIQYTWNNSPL